MPIPPPKCLLTQLGVLGLERQALTEPQLAAASAGDDPRVLAVSRQVFGYEPQEAARTFLFGAFADQEEIDFEDDFEPRLREIEDKLETDDRSLMRLFQGLDWDVSDDLGRPLLVLTHFKYQLYLKAKGFGPAGTQQATTDDWTASLEAEARTFRPER